MARRAFRGRTSGSNIDHKFVFVCNGCGLWHVRLPSSKAKPYQCEDSRCGRMDFTLFHSQAEAKRFAELELERKVGRIADLKLQVPYKLHTYQNHGKGGIVVVELGKYLADFAYVRDGQQICEDVKGNVMTDLAAWKIKHVEAEYGIKVEIIRR